MDTYFGPFKSLTFPGSKLPVSAPQQGEAVPQTEGCVSDPLDDIAHASLTTH
jgi:hypothetical protein